MTCFQCTAQTAEQASTPSSDVVSCLHYFSALGLLVAGTTAGEVVMWSYSGQQNRSAGSSTVYKDSLQQDPTACWKLQKSVHVEGQVNAVACSLQDR